MHNIFNSKKRKEKILKSTQLKKCIADFSKKERGRDAFFKSDSAKTLSRVLVFFDEKVFNKTTQPQLPRRANAGQFLP